MAKPILDNSSSKLNLNRRQTDLLQKIIFAGNQMSDALSALDRKMLLPKKYSPLSRRWSDLMTKLALMLIL